MLDNFLSSATFSSCSSGAISLPFNFLFCPSLPFAAEPASLRPRLPLAGADSPALCEELLTPVTAVGVDFGVGFGVAFEDARDDVRFGVADIGASGQGNTNSLFLFFFLFPLEARTPPLCVRITTQDILFG